MGLMLGFFVGCMVGDGDGSVVGDVVGDDVGLYVLEQSMVQTAFETIIPLSTSVYSHSRMVSKCSYWLKVFEMSVVVEFISKHHSLRTQK